MMAIPFSLAASTPSSGGRANGQLIIPPAVNRDRQNSPSNSNLAAINAAGATMRMRNGRNGGTLRCTGLHHADEPDDEPVLTAMAALFESLHEVHLEGGSDPWKPSIKTADGFRACKQFLYALSAAADALKIRPQSREYRNQFTKNYRALFPDQKRHYRVDVLEASQEGYTMIYVNGERFDFHGSVVESGVNFKLAWITAMDKLQQLQRQNLSTYLYWRSELVPILVDLDSKWADFEQEYILELIQIERKARRYVMDVIYLENQLIYLDGSVATLVAKGDASETAHLHIWQQWQSCRRDYVRKIFRLNAIANYRRRGRGDLSLSVLETAENIIKTSESHPGHVYEAVSSIAASCVTSFNDFRKHINELAQTPERIDPHLCNNVTLVNHLVRLEETWELAQKYLMDTQRLQNIIHIVDFILSVVRTQKAIIAILSSADAAAAAAAGDSSSSSNRSSNSSSSSSSSSNCTSSVNFDRKMRSTTVTGAATTTAATHLECEKKRSLEDIFSSSSSASCSFSTFSSNPAFSGCCCSSSSTTTTTSTTNNCRDTGSERPPHQPHQHEEEEEEDCEELTATSDSGMLHSGAFISQKKENAIDAAGMTATAAAATGSSISRSDTLSCTTRGSIMRQRTSSSTSADRRETLEEKLIACDVEAFLALPRFVCLYYLLDPIHRFHILRQFLPHYFVDCQGLSDSCVETAEEVYSKNSQQQQQQQHMSLFAPLRKGSGAATASSTEGGGGEAAATTAAAASTAAPAAASTATVTASTAAAANTAAAAAGCTSSSTGSSDRRHCTRSVEQLQKTGAPSAAATTLGGGGESASAASTSSAPVRGGGSSRGGANAGFRCPDFFTEDAEDEQEAGMDVQQQQIQQEGEVEEEDDDEGKEKEEDCRLLSIAASDATTRPPSRLSSNFDTAVSLAGTTVSPAASQLSTSSFSLPAAASTAAAVVSAAAAACENGQHLCDMGCCRQNACSSRSKLLTSQEEAESEGSTECSSSLRESTDSGISSSSSSSSFASAGSASAASFDFSSSSSSSSTYANALTNTAIVATPAIATSSTEVAAFAPSSVAIAAAAPSCSSTSSCTTGQQQQQQQQKGLRGYVCSGSKVDRHYHCNSSNSNSSTAATAANERMCSNEWFVQQQQHSSRIILSKVPAGLKKMVKAWMRIQSWLKAEGLQDSKEAWLCIIARLSDSEDFKLLLQKWAETKLAGFRHHLEGLFQSVEEISMALQRSSPQDWNEFLQAIIQGIQSDSPSRRSLL